MKILIIMDGFFPGQKYGGPPVSVDNFCSLMTDMECFIVTHNHDLKDTEVYPNVEPGWNQRDNCKVWYLSDAEYNIRTFEHMIKVVEPDVIYLQGLFQSCIVPCLILARKYKIKVLLAPRGELCRGAFKKKYKKIPYIIAIRLMGLIRHISLQSTSEEETEAIIQKLGVGRDRIYYLTNIPSIPTKDFAPSVKEEKKARLIFLSRIVEKKNLHYAIECLKKVQGEVVLDVYGSMEDSAYWNRCQQIAQQLPAGVIVNYCGHISHDQVHETFSRYDAFLFPTLSENFGHVIIEALSVGCPAVLSDQTPWVDLEQAHAGWAFPLQEPERFSAAVQYIVDQDEEQQRVMRKAARQYVNRKLKLDDLRRQYEAVLGK